MGEYKRNYEEGHNKKITTNIVLPTSWSWNKGTLYFSMYVCTILPQDVSPSSMHSLKVTVVLDLICIYSLSFATGGSRIRNTYHYNKPGYILGTQPLMVRLIQY